MSPPSTIGKYQIDRRLGGGGMAEVFLAKRMGAEGFSRKVAIKRVLPGVSASSSFASLFIGEAKISAQLHHPNIVSILDFDRDPEHGLFLVMELVEGRDLAELLDAGWLPVPLTLHLIAEVLLGLGHAHSPPEGESEVRGVVHRDVSPHNVLLSWEGAVKVSDFGIAKARAASQASASMLIKGKPSYMSPEQANGENLDGRSDLFAVGVMLWEMLVGRSLFGRETLQETLAALFTGNIPSPSSIRPEVPEEVSRVALRLLQRDRTQRYATAEEARRELLACSVAPRDGRAELAEVLRARFGGRAADRARAPTLVASGPLPLAAASPLPLSLGTPPPSTANLQHASPSAAATLRVRPSSRLGLIFAAVVLAAGAATAGLVALVHARRDEPEADATSAPRERTPVVDAEKEHATSPTLERPAPRSVLDAGPLAERGAPAEPERPARASVPVLPSAAKPGKKPTAPLRTKQRASPDSEPSGIVDLRVE
jgi:serine/threonine protein kinase